ncbi:hypothetical protein CERSUDRAFT_89230 [Gelatoporia subvermispora B]|uniref:MYND-type domain-containing protein n=1 Tax=Ceriporiopsis subvermispora (strain B) TaxID=914234 RepID=M2P7Q1_CERS8|nr:hypothetical protein CERSUDRAFT_89230 [Gelatoporia subvermispora B]
MYFKDRWDDQTQRLVITWSPSPAHNVASMDGALLTTLKAFFLHLPNVKPHDSIFKSRLSKAWEIHQSALATKLLAQGRADPAFVHALKTAGRYYIHKEGSVPYMRRDVEKFVETWNAAIDYYITHGVDKRETYEIERNAKLGKNLGALIARCEADGCSAVESRSVRLLRCMKCQQILYCSKQCQRAHWRRHKAACLDIAAYQVSDLDAEESTAEKYVQLLPSQEMYELELMELQKESLRAISRMKTITQVFKRNPPMEAAGVIMALDSHALFESSRTLDGPRHTMVCIETPV